MSWHRRTDRVAIIAGSGRLPVLLAETLSYRGVPPFVISLPVCVDPALDIHDKAALGWERIGDLFAICADRNIQHVVLAGGVDSRPNLRPLAMNWPTLKLLPQVLHQHLQGDDKVLGTVISLLEQRGLTVLGADDITPCLMLPAGALTGKNAGAGMLRKAAKGFDLLRAVGPFDMGQGCIMVGERPVAVEGAEGTDGMLRRVVDMRINGRLPQRRGGLLIKGAKQGQDLRVDLPTIGTDTIRAAVAAGLDGIVLEAGKALVLDREDVATLADKADMFVVGMAT